jgi:hypothetical protein
VQHVWPGEQPKKAYKDFVGQIDWMVDAQVRWTPYAPAIPEHFEPGPTRPAGPARARPAPGLPTNLTGRAWAEILKLTKKFFGPSPARNAVFSCFTL